MENREFWLQIPYDNLVKFPYGFARSGIFSLPQAQMLENNGCLIHALLNDQVSNPTQSDINLTNAINRGEICDDEMVNVWLKYTRYSREILTLSDIKEKSTDKLQSVSNDKFVVTEDDKLLPEEDIVTDEYLHAS